MNGPRKCGICKQTLPGIRELQTHQRDVHGTGSLAPGVRQKAGKTRQKLFRSKKLGVLPTKIFQMPLPKPPAILKGASFDRDTPWNLGLIDALNMARKSIERSLEIIEGQGK
jgi:hypothetical protein